MGMLTEIHNIYRNLITNHIVSVFDENGIKTMDLPCNFDGFRINEFTLLVSFDEKGILRIQHILENEKTVTTFLKEERPAFLGWCLIQKITEEEINLILTARVIKLL